MKKFLTLFAALMLLGSMTVQADTWTPAGTPASVFGSEWDPANTDNDMVLSNGLYVFAKSVNISSNTDISFKVCKNNDWSVAYPSANYNTTLPAGTGYVIITYNASGNAVNAYAISSMTVAGDNTTLFGTTWAPANTDNDMTLDGGVYKFVKTGVALSAGTANFKVCANHSWDNAWPSSNYSLAIAESGNYNVTITFDPATLAVNGVAELQSAAVVIPAIAMHGTFTGSWADTEEFSLAANEETASLTLTNVAKGDYSFGVKIDGTWTASSSIAFSRSDNSHEITSGSGDISFAADRNGDYTFTWTFATNTLSITYPAIPAQSVAFNLAASIQKGSTVNLADAVTPAGIDNPGYVFYVKEKNGEYSSAIVGNSYTFDALGEFVVKVEALENNAGESVASDEANVAVYDAYTFTNGTTIYVDFTAVDGDAKGVNYPLANSKGTDYDAAGAGSRKTVTFSTDVEWTTNDVFIKTAKSGWAELKFTVPGSGQDLIKVAADGASYTWDTYVPVYTVVGSSAAIFGTSWDPSLAANDMTLNAGVYTFEKTDVELPQGNVTLKVVRDHAYANGEWPAQNYTLAIPEAGTYTITITFDPSDTDNEVSATATKTGSAEVENTAGILGNWDNWAATEDLTLSVGKESASLTKHFDAGNYEFKIVVNGSDYRSNGYTYHRGYTATEGITSEGTSMILNADIAGDYTFTWTFATNKIEITFPELTWSEVRTGLSADKYYTVCWPKKMLYVRGATVWSFAGKDASTAYLVKEEGSLDAGKPYIIFAEGATFEAVLVGDDEPADSNNGLHGTLSYMDADDLAAAGATHMLYNNELRPLGSNNHLDANRAYVILSEITGGAPAPGRNVRMMPMQGNVATSIENSELNGENGACKVLINGQLFIIRGENVYGIDGQCVK